MKKSGCTVLVVILVLGVGVIFGTSKLLYFLLTLGTAGELSFFHSNTIAFHQYYTVVPYGPLFTRIVVLSMFTLFFWVILYLIGYGYEKLAGQKTIYTKVVNYLGALLLTYTLLAHLFIPGAMVEYDVNSRQIKITDHQPFLHIWPNPAVASHRTIPFDEVVNIKYSSGEDVVRGAAHLEIWLYAITQQDTIPIGKNRYYHGEFGWIIDWRSREDIILEAESEAEANVLFLRNLIGIEL